MNFRVIKQLYKKEMLDVLRDKKTVIMMLIVPILIYPLMFVGGMVMMSKVTTQMDTQTYEIAVDFMDTNPELVQMFLQPDDDTLHFKLRVVSGFTDGIQTFAGLSDQSLCAFALGKGSHAFLRHNIDLMSGSGTKLIILALTPASIGLRKNFHGILTYAVPVPIAQKEIHPLFVAICIFRVRIEGKIHPCKGLICQSNQPVAKNCCGCSDSFICSRLHFK